MQRRCLQLVGHFAGGAILPLEVVGIDRLRRTIERVDHLVELPGGEIHQVQEGTLAQPRIRVGRARAHQQRRAVDAAARQHVMLGLDRDLAPGRRHATFIHGHAFKAADGVAAVFQVLGAGQVEQFAALFQRRGNGGHQHRLLGVDRAPHAAITQVEAAAHVARDHVPAIAELFAAFADHIIVGIWWNGPGGDAQALFHLFEPWRHFGAAVAFDRVFTGPVGEGGVGCTKA
ncbi:hypothetical protein [Pseudomonas sp. 22 E 5]|nr:hypothetical protein [Pseudomonas sp. 22 E 5]